MPGKIWLVCSLVLMLISVFLAGCSSSSIQKDRVTSQLNWYHATEFVGYYMADARGYYTIPILL